MIRSFHGGASVSRPQCLTSGRRRSTRRIHGPAGRLETDPRLGSTKARLTRPFEESAIPPAVVGGSTPRRHQHAGGTAPAIERRSMAGALREDRRCRLPRDSRFETPAGLRLPPAGRIAGFFQFTLGGSDQRHPISSIDATGSFTQADRQRRRGSGVSVGSSGQAATSGRYAPRLLVPVS